MNSGLVRKPHYEEVLAAAIREKTSKHGILSVPMQRFATEAVNSPLFQRVQATLEGSLEAQEKKTIEAKIFEQNLTKAAMDAKIPRADYKWATENLNPPPPPQPPQQPPSSDAKIDYARVAAEMDAVMQRRATETSHKALAAELAQELARQTVLTPAQQRIREHHHHYITQPIMMRPEPGQTMTENAKRVGKSVHEQFIEEQASSSTDIPIRYFRKDGPNTTVPVTSNEFPDVMMRPIAPRGNVKQIADKIDNRPPSPGPSRPPVERTGSVKTLKIQFDKPSSVKKVEPSALRDIAKKKLLEIADRASQGSTNQQSFARQVEVEAKKKRGDLVQKRKVPGPDLPRSMLRKPAPAQSNTRQRIYGPRTQVFDMSDPVRAY